MHTDAQDFISPMDIPLYLSGNFGELRSNHFHTGIDIKTQGKSGIPVKAVADGHVFRIKISPSGYGNALYIKHPNGYSTVYAHLSKFSDAITQAVRKEQYKQKSFAVNFFPDASALPVKQGEIIALSGNSGGSSGPHLHFEIRDSKTEEPLNPLLYNFPIKDDIPPSIYGLMVYPLDNMSHVNGFNHPQNFACGGEFANYRLKDGDTISANGSIGFAFHIIDRLNGYPNKCGFYDAVLTEDGEPIWQQKMDRLNFATNRFINAHMDFEYYKRKRKSYHRFYSLPNNKLDLYPIKKATPIQFAGGEKKKYVLDVVDAYQNKSTFQFHVHGDHTKKKFQTDAKVKWNEPYQYEDALLRVEIPAEALYQDEAVAISSKGDVNGNWKESTIGDPYTPLHKSFTAKVNMDFLPDSLIGKLYAVKYSPKNGKPYPSGGNGNLETKELIIKSRNFGRYSYGIDTIAPRITKFNVSDGGGIASTNSLTYNVKETESGLKSYNLYIDDQWVLLEYLPKRKLLRHSLEPNRYGKGEKTVRLELEDYRGNKRTVNRKINIL